MVRQLFIAGCGRSGTTALAEYLNEHPQVCVFTERYPHLRGDIYPEMFSFSQVMDIKEDETRHPKEWYEELVARKDEEHLKWVGDKHPGYFRYLRKVAENNPRAAILFTYRSLEEVAASYAERSRNPKDPWLGGKDGVSRAVKDWNAANRSLMHLYYTRPFFPFLVVDYDRFFTRPEENVRELERFLKVEFDRSILDTWKQWNESFAEHRTRKPLSEDEIRRLQEHADRESEAWVTGYLSDQSRPYLQSLKRGEAYLKLVRRKFQHLTSTGN